MKMCFKCNIAKPLTEFYKHSRMADGHLNKCKECTKRDTRQNRRKRLDYYREYDRVRAQEPHRVERAVQITRRMRTEHPEKYSAHSAVQKAVLRGHMVRPEKCEACLKRSEHIHAHHDDYSKPLEVKWLCPSCHKAFHMGISV